MKKVSVGLLIFTELPHHGTVALLQRRGAFDFTKMKPETYPGLCQVTVRGGVQKHESLNQALLREVGEELGVYAKKLTQRHLKQLRVIGQTETETRIIYTYALKLPHSILSMIQLHRSSGGLHIIRASDLSKVTTGETSRPKHITMFPDEKAALRKAFGLRPRR